MKRGPKKTVETNPEIAFVDVDLLDLYRRLRQLPDWSRTKKATTVAFMAAVKEGEPLPAKPQQAQARKMLRQLLELERTAPPPARSRVTSSSKRRSGTSSGLISGRFGRPTRAVAKATEAARAA